MGDGMLAIFPTGDGRSATSAAKCALDAALQARRNTADINTERRYDGIPVLTFGIALNIGDIHYGNIGSEDRLDFTAIGPAVNLSARMEVSPPTSAAISSLPTNFDGTWTQRPNRWASTR